MTRAPRPGAARPALHRSAGAFAGCGVLVAAVHAGLAEALAAQVRTWGADATAWSGTVDGLLRCAAETAPQLCIVDEALGGRDVLATRLRAAAPATSTVLLRAGAAAADVDMVSPTASGVALHRGCGIDVLRRTSLRLLRGERLPVEDRLTPSTATSGSRCLLSDRERQILGCIARGCSNPEIADELGISVNTVRTHVQNLLRKLDVDRRSKVVEADLLGIGPDADTTKTRRGPRATEGASADRPVVIVVGTNRVFAEALAAVLSSRTAADTVPCLGHVEEAHAHLGNDAQRQGVVVLHLSDRSRASQAVRELAGYGWAPLTIGTATPADPHRLVEDLEAGLQGWIGTEATLEEVVTAVGRAASGEMHLSPSVLTPVLRRLLTTARGRAAAPPVFVDSLSPRELEILRCLVAGMTQRQTADRLFLSVHTVHTHVQRMMRRADHHTTVALVAMARRQGVLPIEAPAVGTAQETRRLGDPGTATPQAG